MIYTYRQWSFTFDMNLDGVVTISDAWLWFKWAFFYPGDAAIWGLINYSASLTTFFHLVLVFDGQHFLALSLPLFFCRHHSYLIRIPLIHSWLEIRHD